MCLSPFSFDYCKTAVTLIYMKTLIIPDHELSILKEDQEILSCIVFPHEWRLFMPRPWFSKYELYVVTLWSNVVPPLSGQRHIPMWNLVTMWYFGMLWPCDPMVYRPWVVRNLFNVQYPPSPETEPLLIIWNAPQMRISLVTPRFIHWTWVTFVSSFTLPASPYPAFA